jgi:hypothetical protein
MVNESSNVAREFNFSIRVDYPKKLHGRAPSLDSE